jgi:hypothetical protein
MSLNEFLDRYIQGDPGYYYFQIEFIWGRGIHGGYFHYKRDARKNLLNKLIQVLDDPEKFFEDKK